MEEKEQELKDNILRECYYNSNVYLGKESFRGFSSNESLLKKCCDELVKDGLLSQKDSVLYKITDNGCRFVTSSSYSFPSRSIARS